MNTNKMNKEIINYNKYGKCIKLSNGNVTCLITIDIGPRIIYYGKDYNLLFEDDQDFINKKREDLNQLKDNSWHIYGGHRLWKAPEDNQTYYPDNKECSYTEKDGYTIVKSEREIDTLIQKEIWVKLNPDNSLDIKNVLYRNDLTKKEAAWSITVLKPHGKIYIPLSKEDTGYLPNRSINFWPYTDILDDRLKIKNEHILIDVKKEDIAKTNPLKIGVFSTVKKAYYIKDDCMIEFETKSKDIENMPDFNSNIEVYTINKMVEVEFLTKFSRPKKKIVLEEKWTLYDKNSKEYKEIKSKI